MKFRVLDNKETGNMKGCILCKASLEDYLENIGDDFDKYDIQRNIVNNPYLDDISATVFGGKHIPVISLVVINDGILRNDNTEIDVKCFKILDGLQRTWRLKTLRTFIGWLMDKYPSMKELKDNFCDVTIRAISAEYRKEMIDLGMNDLKRAKDIASQIFTIGSYDEVLNSFRNNIQWFEVWYGLGQDEIIKEMLLLNAGHKTMSGKHQVELLYLNWLEAFSAVSNVIIRRDKDIKSAVRFVQERKVKEYRFSDLVLATLAFGNGKVNDIQSTIVMRSYENLEESGIPADKEYYITIISFIAFIDDCLNEYYGEIGIEWFGRANIMEAFCAAAGAWYKEFGENKPLSEVLPQKQIEIKKSIRNLNIENFEVAKNMLDATKVSIGQKMKKVVFEAMCEFFKDDKILDWNRQFSMQ